MAITRNLEALDSRAFLEACLGSFISKPTLLQDIADACESLDLSARKLASTDDDVITVASLLFIPTPLARKLVATCKLQCSGPSLRCSVSRQGSGIPRMPASPGKSASEPKQGGFFDSAAKLASPDASERGARTAALGKSLIPSAPTHASSLRANCATNISVSCNQNPYGATVLKTLSEPEKSVAAIKPAGPAVSNVASIGKAQSTKPAKAATSRFSVLQYAMSKISRNGSCNLRKTSSLPASNVTLDKPVPDPRRECLLSAEAGFGDASSCKTSRVQGGQPTKQPRKPGATVVNVAVDATCVERVHGAHLSSQSRQSTAARSKTTKKPPKFAFGRRNSESPTVMLEVTEEGSAARLTPSSTPTPKKPARFSFGGAKSETPTVILKVSENDVPENLPKSRRSTGGSISDSAKAIADFLIPAKYKKSTGGKVSPEAQLNSPSPPPSSATSSFVGLSSKSLKKMRLGLSSLKSAGEDVLVRVRITGSSQPKPAVRSKVVPEVGPASPSTSYVTTSTLSSFESASTASSQGSMDSPVKTCPAVGIVTIPESSTGSAASMEVPMAGAVVKARQGVETASLQQPCSLFSDARALRNKKRNALDAPPTVHIMNHKDPGVFGNLRLLPLMTFKSGHVAGMFVATATDMANIPMVHNAANFPSFTTAAGALSPRLSETPRITC